MTTCLFIYFFLCHADANVTDSTSQELEIITITAVIITLILKPLNGYYGFNVI